MSDVIVSSHFARLGNHTGRIPIVHLLMRNRPGGNVVIRDQLDPLPFQILQPDVAQVIFRQTLVNRSEIFLDPVNDVTLEQTHGVEGAGPVLRIV